MFLFCPECCYSSHVVPFVSTNKAVSPTRMILLSTAGGFVGKEGLLLRRVGPFILWSLVLITLLLVWFSSPLLFGGMVALLILLVAVNAPNFLMALRS